MMTFLDQFYPFFNIVLGVVFLLIGLNVIAPFKRVSSSAKQKKNNVIYILLGVVLIIGGFISFL